jgi:hypothetical protein
LGFSQDERRNCKNLRGFAKNVQNTILTIIKEAKSRKRNYEFSMDVIPVSFSTEHKSMLGNCKMLLERDGGYIAINTKFDKLITSLRTAVENDGMLNKEATSYDDVFDAFRLAMCYYRFTESRRRSLLSI